MNAPRLLLASAALVAYASACAPSHASKPDDSPYHPPRAPHVAQHGDHAHHSTAAHRFDDAEKWAKVFDDPARDEWQRPDEVIAALAIPHGARVADLGAGTGYFAIQIARQRPDVTIYGVDLEESMVKFLDDRAQREGLSNVESVHSSADDARLARPVHLVLIVNTYHHLSNRPAYFKRLAERSLLPRGRVAVIDFTKSSPRGPPPEHKLTADEVIEELKQAGLRLSARHDFLPDQYFLVFEREEDGR